METDMDIQKLKYFQTVAELEHVTRAAEELHVAQPSLTKAMHILEDELGVPLFKKQGRRVGLTEYGIYLKKRLELLIPEFDRLPDEINRLKNTLDKTIKLNILAASSFVVNALMRYKKTHEDVVFDFEQNDLKSDCDILITTNGANTSEKDDYVLRDVKKEHIFLAVPKQSVYAEKENVNLSDVKNENFIMLSNARLFGVICNKFCSAAGFTPKILFESDSPSAVQNIISTGAGVAFWPDYSWGKMKNKNIALLPISSPVCQRDLIFELRDRTPKSEKAEEFYKFLLKQFQMR